VEEDLKCAPRYASPFSRALFVPNSTFWGENRKRLSKMHKKAAQSLAGAGLTVPGRKNLRNRKIILNESSQQNKSLRKQIK
jgi:hypothetical protein